MVVLLRHVTNHSMHYNAAAMVYATKPTQENIVNAIPDILDSTVSTVSVDFFSVYACTLKNILELVVLNLFL